MDTRYTCRLDWHDEGDATEVSAGSPRAAAERYVDRRNANECEYPGERLVLVLVAGIWRRFEVTTRIVSEYESVEVDEHGRRVREGYDR